MDGDPGVGRERPRGGGPHHEVGGVTHHPGVGVLQGQQDVGRLVLLVGVDAGLAELVAGQRGAAPRAVGDDLQVLVEQALVEEVLEVPPDGLDVVGVEGPVGGGEVHPVADPLGELLPVLHVVEDRGPAEPGELGDAHLVLDLALAGDAQPALDLHLHREAVGVPAGPAGDQEAAHGAVAAEEVLVDPGPHVVQAGPAVGRGRTLVEDPGLGPLPAADRALEDQVPAPAGQLLLLQRDEVGVGRDGAEQGLSRSGRAGGRCAKD